MDDQHTIEQLLTTLSDGGYTDVQFVHHETTDNEWYWGISVEHFCGEGVRVTCQTVDGIVPQLAQLVDNMQALGALQPPRREDEMPLVPFDHCDLHDKVIPRAAHKPIYRMPKVPWPKGGGS